MYVYLSCSTRLCLGYCLACSWRRYPDRCRMFLLLLLLQMQAKQEGVKIHLLEFLSCIFSIEKAIFSSHT